MPTLTEAKTRRDLIDVRRKQTPRTAMAVTRGIVDRPYQFEAIGRLFGLVARGATHLRGDCSSALHLIERLRTQQRKAERQAEHLFQTLLHGAFRGELKGRVGGPRATRGGRHVQR